MDDHAAFLQRVEALRAGVDRRLAELAPAVGSAPDRLVEAVRYSLLAPGKRFRPMVTLLAAAELGAPEGAALDVACAFEMIHAASLILDDLPSMDDAGLRRGLPTIHRAFDEATAILAGVGLLNQAYVVIAADQGLPASLRAELAGRAAQAVGFSGLIAGQARDLFDREQLRDPAALERLNHEKTGVLIVAAAQGGALVAGASPAVVEAMGVFARHIGLAFQIRDDLIDAQGSVEAAGKDVGKDAAMATVASTLGLAGAGQAMEAHLAKASGALALAGCDGLLGRYVGELFARRKAAA
ncbi:geranylgeranyl diphosphate synthase type II [Caulobacter rhizosphaerae]|jgi:geranylgeranyl diphosphate synthase type II|uniref:Geranylgeranyl diphosphate synthase type II n=1 Tax=Caulobacter rhizosphaerae TaxID=2010972 RepID=A0ABU1N8H8_9CAUL|nr:polyprenyl synthetase family protein [Caulobacter rhizosphaerae]MDR6534196.1 geranylgeranyl diphosphate synthase type II [Caulobacter rhizosphaerae]